MESYQQRVFDEMRELLTKHQKLDAFMEGSVYKSLPKAEQDRLSAQSFFMLGYLDCLKRRTEAF